MKRVLFQLVLVAGICFPPKEGSSQNLLVDGDFQTTTSITPFYTDPPPLFQWATLNGTGASFTTSVQNGIVSYLIDDAGFGMWQVQLDQFGFSLQAYHRYRLSFDVKADADRDFGVFLGEHGGNWTNLNPSYTRHATADWQTITIDVNSISVFALYQLSFEMGGDKTNMHFAHIGLTDLGPMKIVIAGTFQSELGCAADWMPDCDNTALTYNSGTGMWSGTFNVPAGCHQYKVTINSSWDINYGENGIPGGANVSLYVPAQTAITFSFDPATHIVQTSPIASGFSSSCLPLVVLVGSFQSLLGCANNWDANCLNTALNYSSVTGQFENDFDLPAGYYEYRTILNGDWGGNNFGDGGIPNGNNYSIYLCQATRVHFSYDPVTHIVTNNQNVQPNTVVIAGSFQSEVGCPGDWQPDCDNTRMHYDPDLGVWVDTLHIPAGHWEYKITINDSWSENYGLYGLPNGANIPLDLCAPAKVVFIYYHGNCSHNVYPQIYADQPSAVVIAGSFQSELGCSGDWQPDCNKTRMTFDPISGSWVDTLLIPAGHWEYKWTLNNSWDQNFGLYGEPNGPSITLDLCYPAKVAFNFYSYNCSGYGYANIITNGVCLNKFYDANLNGYPDAGEEPMSGVQFTLTGDGITRTQSTDKDGKAVFSNLPDGQYVIKEKVPSGYFASIADSQVVYLFGSGVITNFGNVCIGPAGAKGIGFWTSRNGEAALNNSGKLGEALDLLRYWSLRNADGTDFDPSTYSQLKTWLLGATAKNMTYMLSAQLAAMLLNIELGYVGYDRSIYTPGCFWWGSFMNVYNLMWYTNFYLLYKTTVDGKDPERGYVDCLKTAFDNANKDLTFVQLHPCGATITKSESNAFPEHNAVIREAKVWPNPSNNYFNLRPANIDSNESVHLTVFDVTGQQVYMTSGSSNKDYRFGERFAPGIYLVELIQGSERSTFKLVKQ